MIQSHHWARNLTIDDQDIEYLTGLLLEKEKPLSSKTLARALVEHRLENEAANLRERYQNARLYNPSLQYAVGDRLIFSEFDYETGIVMGLREGNNPDYSNFSVIQVKFDNPIENTRGKKLREFAAGLTVPLDMIEALEDEPGLPFDSSQLNVESILESSGDHIVALLEERLRKNKDLIYMAHTWFPRDLMMEINVGHLNLAEAVLDMSEGGPLHTNEIIEQIGGVGKAPIELQVFSLNYGLRQDSRFDEVGPTGEVLWFLSRLEPTEVLNTPPQLRYSPIDYNRDLITPDLLALEAEIDDELTEADQLDEVPEEVKITLIFPHRRLGTLPLSLKTETIFPTARQSPRVWFTMVDGQDGEEFPAWVVRKERYVYGLAPFYRKHKLPIGAFLTLKQGAPGKVIINFDSYKARTEWIRLMVPKQDGLTFENQKRGIGAAYDEQMIIGADDLAGVEALALEIQKQKRPLISTLKLLIGPLGSLTPQGTVHAKTLYSALNALRRCPPGPIFAALAASPDFQNVGGHYWKLSNEQER